MATPQKYIRLTILDNNFQSARHVYGPIYIDFNKPNHTQYNLFIK